MPATQSLRAGLPDYLESWIFRRRWLRQQKTAARGQAAVESVTAPADPALDDNAAAGQPRTPREAAGFLAEMAACFRVELDRASDAGSNLQRRKLGELTGSFHDALRAAGEALGHYAGGGELAPELRQAAARIATLLDALQTNLPVWHVARALQLFAGDCQRLARTAGTSDSGS